MDKTSIIVVLLGIISVATGLAAEFTRVEASEVTVDVYGRCSYPSSPALLFGIASAATLLIAKIIINFATGCFCCKTRTANSKRSDAICLCIAFWVTFIIAIGLLLTGAKLNERNDDAVVKNGYYYCYVIKPGVFASGAVVAGLSCIFGVVYYRTLNTKGKDAGTAQNSGIALAQPQFPV